MATTSTSLTLLMRDGAVSLTFEPALDVSQYEELLERVAEAELIDELQALAKMLGNGWRRRVVIG